MAAAVDLLPLVKQNLIVTHDEDDELIVHFVEAAISYAESYQHMPLDFYSENDMSKATGQAVIMLSTHFYESRDGSTGGFFGDSPAAGQQVWDAVNRLLRMDKDVLV